MLKTDCAHIVFATVICADCGEHRRGCLGCRLCSRCLLRALREAGPDPHST